MSYSGNVLWCCTLIWRLWSCHVLWCVCMHIWCFVDMQVLFLWSAVWIFFIVLYCTLYWIELNWFVLYCTLYCIVHCTLVFCTLYCFVYCIVLNSSVLYLFDFVLSCSLKWSDLYCILLCTRLFFVLDCAHIFA